ncbi:MAG TPA: type II toxin-antitoxin system YafQ family toxin [Stellaceae bacterium]
MNAANIVYVKDTFVSEKSGRHGRRLDAELLETVTMLVKHQPHRDCRIRPDLILIYRKPDGASLELVRLGSHSGLGL